MVLTFLLTILKNPFTPESVCNFLRCFAVMLFPTLQKAINILNHDEEANDKLLSATNLMWYAQNLNAITTS